MNAKPQSKSYVFSPEREKRVADALRENLRKRKAQQQLRQDPPAAVETVNADKEDA